MTDSALPHIATHRFRPLKTHFFVVAFVVVLCIIAIGFHPLFALTLLAPALYSLWILRVRTTVGPRGITAVYLFGSRRSVPWSKFKGLFFNKSGRAFAVTTDDTKIALPAITFNSLPELKEATNGLIPDPVTPARLAQDEKVEVFNKEGYSVLKPKGEVTE